MAIIGTGATAVQCVPHLARACKELLVFQRTPSSVDVRANAPIDPEWFASIATPGWQQRWLENFTDNQAGGGAEEDLVKDGWTDLSRRIREKMKTILKPKDYDKTATRAKELRWQNNTRWARQAMVDDGRLKNTSPTGLWEISDKGRAWLKKQ